MNEKIFQLFFQLARNNLFFDQVGIFLASYLPYLLVLALLVLVASLRDWRRRVIFVIELILAVILGRGILAGLVYFISPQMRPAEALGIDPLISVWGPAFPSGHATVLFSVAAIVFFVNRRWGVWFFILAFINGLARIFVGAHFPSDILAGIFFGILGGMIVYKLILPHVSKLGLTVDSESEIVDGGNS